MSDTEQAEMVETQIRARGIRNEAVLRAMEAVPRAEFVPPEYRAYASEDGPLPIGMGQTISQPYIVALMTESLDPQPEDRVLDVGTGSGYQAAVLAECVAQVYSIEILPGLADEARRRLERLRYGNVTVRTGDGSKGLPEEAPFDGILVAAAPARIPQPLLDQLKVGARLVIPIGVNLQDLWIVTRTEEGFDRQMVCGVRFVPMTGETHGS